MSLSLAIEIYFVIILLIFGFLFFSNLFRLDKYSMIEIIWYYDTPSYIEEE